MSDKPKVIRVNETPQQRVDRLRSEMHAVGDPPTSPPPPKTPQQLSDEALAKDRHAYSTMAFDVVLETEIRVGLALPYDKLYPNARYQLIKAGVDLIKARMASPPSFGSKLDETEEAEGA